MGLDEWLVKVFLIREACVSVLVGELDLFSLECNELSSSEFGVSMGNSSTLATSCKELTHWKRH